MNRILIVEDEVPIAQLIEMSLARAGYQCEAVNDGCAAADKIEQNDYDLVLLDIMLPGLDGYELLEYLRPMGTPVIFITAKGTLGDRVRGLNLGAALYRDVLFEHVWGGEMDDGTRTLDLHIQRLRKKLGWQEHIKTVYKVGYLLEMEGEP